MYLENSHTKTFMGSKIHWPNMVLYTKVDSLRPFGNSTV